MQKPFQFRFLRRPHAPVVVGFVIILGTATALYFGFFGPKSTRQTEPQFDKIVLSEPLTQADVQLIPTKGDSFGVASDTHFILTTKNALALASVEQALAIAPSVPFSIEAKSDTQFEITPRETLAAGTVYRIALGSTVQQQGQTEKRSLSWAFQATPDFRIEGTLPRNHASGVPVDTGIEVTFSTNKYGNVEEYISLSPSTPGRFERHGRVVAFVPTKRLTEATLYTLTVRRGLPIAGSSTTLSEDVVVQFETAAPRDTYTGGIFDQAFTSFQPDEPPVLSFQAFGNNSADVRQATVYQFRDAAQLMERARTIDEIPLWAYTARRVATYDTSGLTRVGTFNLDVQADALRFPSGFEVGYYLVELLFGNRKVQTPFIVSDLAAAATVTTNDTVLWVYDLSTDRPVNRAAVTGSIENIQATTNEQGLARFASFESLQSSNPTQARAYLTVAANNKSTLVPVISQDQFSFSFCRFCLGNNTGFWTYLWSDRTLYRPTDTINSWGIAKNRLTNTPTRVDIELSSWNSVDAAGNYIPHAKTQVTADAFGAFQASLAIDRLKPGYYTLSVKVDGVALSSQSIEVRTFQKPAFRIVATPKALAGYDGDEMEIDIRTEFFDGTPAPEVRLKYGEGYGEMSEEITTNAQGRVTLKKRLVSNGREYPDRRVFQFAPAVEIEGQVAGETAIFIYPSSVTIDPVTTRTGSRGRISLTTREVELPTKPLNWWEERLPGDGKPAPNTPITGTLSEIIVTQTKIGTRYDFVEKRVVDQYSYSQREENRESFTGTTDAQGRYERQFELPGEQYKLVLTAVDTQGRRVQRTAYYYDSERLAGGNNTDSFFVADVGAQQTGQPVSYAPGERATLGFYSQGGLVERRGAFLFVEMQNGVRATTVTSEPTLAFTMEEADAPGVSFSAIWFDGSGFRAPEYNQTAFIDFDQLVKELTVSITTDRAQYGPGDTAELIVRTTNREGEPVRARVNLSAIDEAINAIQNENTPSVLETLYRPITSGLLQTYVSTRPLRLELGAEGGGGSGDPRSNFQDAPLFTSVDTGNSGVTRVRFPLPDNITSWRVTAHGITADLQAGHTVTAVPVTRPLFGTLTLNEEFVLGDRPVVIARAYGTSLSSNTSVSFRLETPGLGQPQTANGRAFEPQRFTLPALQLGTYELKLTVTVASQRDVHVRRFTVLPSRLTKATSQWVLAEPGLTLEGSDDERTTIVVSDAGRGRVISTARGLAWSWGKRLERHLGSRIAGDILHALEQPVDVGGQFNPLDFQVRDGGLALVNYGSSELRLSALAAARSDLFDGRDLQRYFENKLSQRSATSEEVGLSLLGLSQLGQPVLADLDTLVASSGISDSDRLHAALGYLALGANDRASAIAQMLLEKYGETQDPFLRLTLGNTDDEKIVHTAAFSILAEGLKLAQRVGLSRYLAENFPTKTITNLERSIALRYALPLLDETPITLRYRFQEQEQSITLEQGRSQAISATPEELAGFRVLDVMGPVALTINSVTALNPTEERRDSRLSVNRRYSVVGRTGTVRQGDIVRVDVTPRVDSGVIDKNFIVTDVLPSGLTFLTDPWNRGFHSYDQGYPYEVDGQRLNFFSSGNKAFHYFALVLMPGRFSAEPAILQGEQSRDLVNYSGGQTLEIR